MGWYFGAFETIVTSTFHDTCLDLLRGCAVLRDSTMSQEGWHHVSFRQLPMGTVGTKYQEADIQSQIILGCIAANIPENEVDCGAGQSLELGITFMLADPCQQTV
jgi:hypothetical protein